MAARRRILFVAEAVTLAQVVRLVTLARALDPEQYDVHFASARFDELIFGGTTFTRHPLYSLSPKVIDARVASGRRLYGRRTLARYIRDERALFAEVGPDLVVGDLRLSLAVSAAVDRIPYASLINAYWSPDAVHQGFPLPDHPIVRLLGVRMAAEYFPRALPFVFRHFARPVNALRRAHGLPELGSLPQVLNAGDHTLFPDVPALVPLQPRAPENAANQPTFLGPVLWSPPVALPAWWSRLDPQRPTLYVTLGSSGRVQRLPLVIDVAASLGFQVLVATAGRADLPTTLPPHVHVADFLPGEVAARRSLAVISNGGSTTGYQALSQGRPVLGIASNLDQYLAMTAIERAGAGLLLRAGTLDG
ncbi:MAG TPA: nucleotide disphospho-sugar-binding domain-containing protein, partial [Polyangia bacterium]|nr:nucleotide disphospho-sugar-binding domain-containing protein [Polyangia bacterium]